MQTVRYVATTQNSDDISDKKEKQLLIPANLAFLIGQTEETTASTKKIGEWKKIEVKTEKNELVVEYLDCELVLVRLNDGSHKANFSHTIVWHAFQSPPHSENVHKIDAELFDSNGNLFNVLVGGWWHKIACGQQTHRRVHQMDCSSTDYDLAQSSVIRVHGYVQNC